MDSASLQLPWVERTSDFQGNTSRFFYSINLHTILQFSFLRIDSVPAQVICFLSCPSYFCTTSSTCHIFSSCRDNLGEVPSVLSLCCSNLGSLRDFLFPAFPNSDQFQLLLFPVIISLGWVFMSIVYFFKPGPELLLLLLSWWCGVTASMPTKFRLLHVRVCLVILQIVICFFVCAR